MTQIAVISGASAGVGRATVREFARNGWDVALLARGEERLKTAAAEVRKMGRRAFVVPTDVADADQVMAAARKIESEFGPIEAWVNVAMATVFSPVSRLEPAEVLRATQVTYLGQVYGMMAALEHMRPRNRGTIVNVGSALTYRSVPLQSVYCGAKAAIRGFTDSLRSELLHDGLNIRVTMVHLPAVNTPQFQWARNRMGRKATPVPPIYQPEVAARAILFGATHDRREVWVGASTVKAIIANRIAPRLLDNYLAKAGYSGQLLAQSLPEDAPDNLFLPAPGHDTARGSFGDKARTTSLVVLTDRHRTGALVAAGVVLAAGVWALLVRRR